MFIDKILYFLANGGTPSAPMPPAAPAVPGGVPAIPPEAVHAAAASGGAGGAISILLVILYILVCISLIVLVLVQTTKNEGLSGIIGGASQSVFRGKKSVEEKFKTYTMYIAWCFLILSIFVSILVFRS